MKGKLLAFALALFGVAIIGVTQIDVKAAVDDSRDCDQFAVVYCGTMTPAEARNKYAEKDHAKIFQSMGISRADLDGSFKNGVVYKDGRVVVDGKTVATGARMAARGLGGTPIDGTGASKVSVSAMGSAQTAMVKMDANGKFLFAIMKPCGNPVTATPPTEPPTQPNPKAECVSLKLVEHEIPRTRFLATAKASATGGAKIKSYSFKVTKGTSVIYDNTYPSAAESQSVVYNLNEPGDYKVSVVVNTSEGPKTGPQCKATVTVTPPPVQPSPAVDITKFVDTDKKYKRVGVNVEYSYKIAVKNTGNTDLKNVVVTDTPDRGITLISVSPPEGKIENNSWMHTIPSLLKGETRTYTLTAKVPVYLAGKLVNTVCVDAPEVPGSPDKCDKAEVDVPPKGNVQVCNPATGEIIEVDETEASKYVPVGSPECEDKPAENPKADTPEALPETGPAETVLSVIGAMSLVGASAYYITSRRQA